MNLLPKELIASQYRDAFKAYLAQYQSAIAHNQRIVDDFILTIKPVEVTKLLLATGSTVTTLDLDEDDYYSAVVGRSIEKWRYYNIAGRSAPIVISPDQYDEPFYDWYFSAHGISTEIRLLAGTDETKVRDELIAQMTPLPFEPAKPPELNWQLTDEIERQVRVESGQDYESSDPIGEAPF